MSSVLWWYDVMSIVLWWYDMTVYEVDAHYTTGVNDFLISYPKYHNHDDHGTTYANKRKISDVDRTSCTL